MTHTHQEMHLFRVLLREPSQLTLSGRVPRAEALAAALKEKRSAMVRKRQWWGIGNVQEIDNVGFYFRIGRTREARVDVYQNGDFREGTIETSPYTHAILDVDLQVLAIAKRTTLAPKVATMADYFGRLIGDTKTLHDSGYVVAVNPLMDPSTFLEALASASRVSRFWVELGFANAFDVDADFYRPMEKVTSAIDASGGKVEFVGEQLAVDPMIKMATSAAKTGRNAGATVDNDHAKGERRSLGEAPAIFSADDLADLDELRVHTKLLAQLRKTYRKLMAPPNG